jgi:hypothetical protein
MSDGELYYRLGYLYDQDGAADKAKAFREKAAPLLEKQAAQKKATVSAYYYLAALYANLARPEDARRTAQRGVERFGGDAKLSGEDLFRLGRLHHFAGQAEGGAAAYHRAVEAFGRQKDSNPVLYALALTADAQSDFLARRFADAARKMEQAAALNPKTAPPPFHIALARLGAGNYPEAIRAFGEIREGDLLSEAQYGADLARKLEAAGGAVTTSAEGKPFPELDNPAIESALGAAAATVKANRQPSSEGKRSDDQVRQDERLFFSLAAEWMLRGNRLRESALAGGYAELLRR